MDFPDRIYKIFILKLFKNEAEWLRSLTPIIQYPFIFSKKGDLRIAVEGLFDESQTRLVSLDKLSKKSNG